MQVIGTGVELTMDERLEELRERVETRLALPSPAECKAIRLAAAVTLEDVANAVGDGTTRSLVWAWENAKARPGPGRLPRYVAVLRLLKALADEQVPA